MKLTKLRLVFVLLFTLVLIKNSLALGLSPAWTTINFQPNLEKEIQLRITNIPAENLKVAIYFEGELANYFSTEQSIVKIEEEQKVINYRVRLPSSLEPGDHQVKIVAVRIPSEQINSKDIVVSASTSVISKVTIRVPYPEKYATAKLYVSDVDVNGTATFTVPVFNLGSESIQAKAEIKILDSTGGLIATLQTGEVEIASQGQAKLQTQWLANVHPGEYTAKLTLYYSGKTFTLEKKFNVGTLFVDIVTIEVQDFSLGEIAKFNIYLQNKWNKKLTGVTADMQVLDMNGRQYTQYTTPTFSLEPNIIGKTEGYWDTKDVQAGTYELKLLLHYFGKVFEKSFMMQVNLKSIDVNMGVGYVVATKDHIDNKTALYILAVIIIIVSNAIWILYFRWMKKKKNQQE